MSEKKSFLISEKKKKEKRLATAKVTFVLRMMEIRALMIMNLEELDSLINLSNERRPINLITLYTSGSNLCLCDSFKWLDDELTKKKMKKIKKSVECNSHYHSSASQLCSFRT